MKKQSDRIKIWREKQKAEGKSSITVLLSLEARTILTEEKEKTGESYSVIVERALRAQNKKSYRLPTKNNPGKTKSWRMYPQVINNLSFLSPLKKMRENPSHWSMIWSTIPASRISSWSRHWKRWGGVPIPISKKDSLTNCFASPGDQKVAGKNGFNRNLTNSIILIYSWFSDL